MTNSAAELIKDSDQTTFMADVIEASKDVPVIVDFWAPWCGPCRSLMPILEKVVKEESGRVKLVKINIDENQAIAAQMRVQSIPAVFAFKDGQPVDGFMGGQPESEIRKFIARQTGDIDIEKESEALYERALDALRQNDLGGAAQDLAAALQINPSHAESLSALARIYIESGAPEQAKGLIESAPDDIQNHPEISSVRALLELGAGEPDNDDELAALRKAQDETPHDLDVKYDLAKALSAAGQNEEAIDILLSSVAINRSHNDDAARKLLITIFEAEGAESELARSGRSRLSSILFA